MLGRKNRDQSEFMLARSMRELIPDDHTLVRVDRVLDLSWLREEVEDCYCLGNGRPRHRSGDELSRMSASGPMLSSVGCVSASQKPKAWPEFPLQQNLQQETHPLRTGWSAFGLKCEFLELQSRLAPAKLTFLGSGFKA
jgi:hypothetical protein